MIGPHVIGYYKAEDRDVVDALDVQACMNCGAVIWRRSSGFDPFPPWRRVGVDCEGTFTAEEEISMAKRATNGSGARVKKPRPTQTELPGTEDSAIAPLESKAKELRSNRDEILELRAESAKIESALISLMHKHGKKTYMRHGIEIVLVGSSEKVKVRYPDANGKDDGDE